jgi:hypothetical protein
MLTELEAQIASVKQTARQNGQQNKKVQDKLDKMVAEADSKDNSSRPKRGAGTLGGLVDVDDDEENGDAMDVDDNGRRGASRTNKRGGFGMIGRTFG